MIVDENLTTILWLADTVVGWQASAGGIDVDRCSFHSWTPLQKPSAYGQDIPWLVRALYAAFDATGDLKYKSAADRYAVYFIATIYHGAPTFAIGDALDPCLSGYRWHNPHEDGLDDKGRTLRDYILERSTEAGQAFDVGYCWRDDQGVSRHDSDAAFSNDLADVGRGLLFYARRFEDKETLEHAKRLASFFVDDFQDGTLNGLWSEKLGTWLIGPHPAKGYENVDEYSNRAGWGWSSYYAAHFLHRLHDVIDDIEMKDRIQHECVRSLGWMFDSCQFEDGALGMAGRDDKWLGMTGLAVILYGELHAKGWLAGEPEQRYLAPAKRALAWLQHAARPGNYPRDGFVAVTGRTRPEPGWNSSWMLGITLEALVAGRSIALSLLPESDR